MQNKKVFYKHVCCSTKNARMVSVRGRCSLDFDLHHRAKLEGSMPGGPRSTVQK